MQHEDFSIIIFKHLLASNPPVLAEVISEGLGLDDIKLIELMIKPQTGIKLPAPWKNREFLCEVTYVKLHT